MLELNINYIIYNWRSIFDIVIYGLHNEYWKWVELPVKTRQSNYFGVYIYSSDGFQTIFQCGVRLYDCESQLYKKFYIMNENQIYNTHNIYSKIYIENNVQI